ncbi:MAG: hypothetical protein WBP93_02035 [Pyrinomonadaceae bacterium]
MKAKLKGVTVYFSPDEYKQIKAKAKLYERTLSSFIREYHCGLPPSRRGAPKKRNGETEIEPQSTLRQARHKPGEKAKDQRNGTLFELN